MRHLLLVLASAFATIALAPVAQAQFAVSPSTLTFSTVPGSSPPSQTITTTNTTSSTLNAVTSTSTTSGGSWLSATPGALSLSPNASTNILVTASSNGLAVGTYSGLVTIQGGGLTVSVTVNLQISASQTAFTVSPTALSFSSSAGVSPPGQTVIVTNTGTGSLSLGISATTQSGGNWLLFSPTSLNIGVNQSATLNVALDSDALGPGNYSGSITLFAPGKTLTIVVSLQVSPSQFSIVVSPPLIGVTVETGKKTETSFTISVPNGGTVAAIISTSGAGLSVTNSHVTAPASVTATVDATALAPGSYSGQIVVSCSNSTCPPVTVPVNIKVVAACSPTRLVVVVTSPSGTVSAGFPVSVTANVSDDCGNPFVTTPFLTGTVFATFSNGDPPISLTSLQNGQWSGTWTPRNVSSQVVLTVTASSSTLTGKATVVLSTTTSSSPVIGAIVDAASFQVNKPLSPGCIFSIFGTNLASGTGLAASLPLPTSLNGTSIVVGGVSAPLLYVSPGQINAIVPYSLPLNTSVQVIILRGSSLSAPTTIAIAAANPGVFTVDGSGHNAGTIFNVDFSLSSTASPSARGSTVVIYCEGLGAISPAVPDGAAATGLSRTVNPVTVSIGGSPSMVAFAGLTPGFAGLYQINAVVPSDASVGQVPVVVSVAGQSSVIVTMVVK